MDDKEKNELRWLHESAMVKLENSNKRSFILNVILLIVILALGGAWIYHESTMVDEVQVIKAEQDSGNGGNNYLIGGDYGEAESDNSN